MFTSHRKPSKSPWKKKVVNGLFGCTFKMELLDNVNFYNNSFHIGPIEKFFLNSHEDCLNEDKDADLDCRNFITTVSCVAKRFSETRQLAKNLKDIGKTDAKLKYDENEDQYSSKYRFGCYLKNKLSMLDFDEDDYFNSSIIANWLENIKPNPFGKFLKNTVDFCDESVKLSDGETPTFNCKYFQIYSSCWIDEVIKSIIKLLTKTPNVRRIFIKDDGNCI